MARNGHPRVPRKVRGERKRVARLFAQGGARSGLGLAAWERELLAQRRRSVKIRKYPTVLPTTHAVIQDAYAPMLEAALKGPLELPIPMSQRG